MTEDVCKFGKLKAFLRVDTAQSPLNQDEEQKVLNLQFYKVCKIALNKIPETVRKTKAEPQYSDGPLYIKKNNNT